MMTADKVLSSNMFHKKFSQLLSQLLGVFNISLLGGYVSTTDNVEHDLGCGVIQDQAF